MDPLISHAWILSDRLGVPCRRICVGAECHKTEDVGKSQGLRSKRCFDSDDGGLSGGQENSMETEFRVY